MQQIVVMPGRLNSMPDSSAYLTAHDWDCLYLWAHGDRQPELTCASSKAYQLSRSDWNVSDCMVTSSEMHAYMQAALARPSNQQSGPSDEQLQNSWGKFNTPLKD